MTLALALAGGEAAAPPAPPPGLGQPRWQAFLHSHSTLPPGQARGVLLRRERAWDLARREGLLHGADWAEFRLQLRRRVLGEAFLESLPGHGALEEARAKAIYLAQGEERRVWHLLCSNQEGAEKALARLRAGEDPGKLAAELSIDGSAKINQGNLGWIRKQQVVPPFGEAVFAVPLGQVAGPIQTEFGWHLAKALEARKPDEEGWKREGAAFTAKLQKEQATLKRSLALKPLRGRYPLEKNMEVLGRDRITAILPGDEKLTAGRVAGRRLSLAELKGFLQATMGSAGGSHSLGAETKGGLLEGLADEVRLEAAAEAKGLPRAAAVQSRLWDGEREEALSRFSRRYLERIKVPDAELESHRLARLDRFLEPGDLQLHQLTFARQDAADQARREADQGAPWSELFQRHADREATGAWDVGWTSVARLQDAVGPAILEQLRNAGDNQIVGPVQGPEGPMLFKILGRRKGPPMGLEQCREAVRADYLKEQGEARVNAFLDARPVRGAQTAPPGSRGGGTAAH